MTRCIALAFIFLLSVASYSTNASEQNTNRLDPTPNTASAPVAIPRLSGDVSVDGELDEPQWKQARTVVLNYITRPFENATPPVGTTAKIFENGQSIFIAFDAQDPDPGSIRALFRDRDQVWGDDLVGIKLDTAGDGRLAYQFFVNPHGIQVDSIENEMTGSESASWNAIWSSAGKIHKKGYRVEIELPFRILNFNDTTGTKRWRAEFVRFYPRDNFLRLSNMPVDRNNACTLCQMGDIEGFASARQGKNLAVVPTVVGSIDRGRNPYVSDDWTSANNQEVGLDVNWGISSDIMLQATLNPDFSQVEADAGQLAVNNPFALFFPERRPFFLENADYFSSLFDLVYTRNINAPDVGTKLTGRMRNHTFGLMVANDSSTSFLVPGNLGSQVARLDEDSINTALRYRYDVSQTLSIGSILTVRSADSYQNMVTGVDTRYQFTDNDVLRAQFLVSETEYPESLYTRFCQNDCQRSTDYSEAALRTKSEGPFTGTTYRVNYRHQERNWFASADHTFRSESFRADLGFESQVDQARSVVGGGYVWWNEQAWWNRLEFSGDWDITHNENGELIEKEWQAQLQLNADYQTFAELMWIDRDKVGLRRDTGQLAIDGNTTLFNEDQIQFYIETQPSQLIFWSGFVRTGDRIDLANNRLGKQLLLESTLSLNVGQHTELTIEHAYNQLEAQGQDVFTTNLTDLRLSYQFDAHQFLRVALIYSDIRRNQENYSFDVDARERNLGSQVVYSYMVNPLTRFFLGYSDNAFANDDLTGLTRDRQTLFMKFTYAWLN